MMPTGFQGIMIHPGDQSQMNKLGSSAQAQTGIASQGEAIGTATLPRVSEKVKPGPSGVKHANMPGGPVKGKAPLPVCLAKPTSSKVCSSKLHHMSRASVAHHLAEALGRAGMAVVSTSQLVSGPSTSGCQHSKHITVNEGSG